MLSAAMIIWLGLQVGAQAQRASPMVPQGWTEESRDSAESPLRYLSPDGTASLALFATPANARSRPSLQLPAEDERITYKRVTPRFVAVSGFKGDRIFYRKSNLACAGKRWHHIVLEYPADEKARMDAIVTRIAHGMNRYDADCRGSASTTSGGLVRHR
jgi:serine/threonine-protein kinase